MKPQAFHNSKIEKNKVEIENANNVEIQWLISKNLEAPNFALRRFTIGKGGNTPYHSHDWEHEVYFLEGKGVLKTEEKEIPVEKDFAAYVPKNEMHQFVNKGDSDLVFLCIVPMYSVK